MTHQHSEAIVLHALPFKECDRILTLFTPRGLLKLIVKIKKKEALHYAALTSPLTRADFYYNLGKKELHRFVEGVIHSQNIEIRQRYETLLAAQRMIEALLISQWADRSTPELYTLFSRYLEVLPSSVNPASLASSFQLKILKHEGLLHLRSPLTARWRLGGECYTEHEAPQGALSLSEEEEMQLVELCLSRSISQISSSLCASELEGKINALFLQAFA